jgi:hypothetical protein
MQKTSLIIILSIFGFFPLQAQDSQHIKIDASLDFVNQNVWRGSYQAGASLQPEAIVNYRNWQFSVWGSTDLQAAEKEIDLSLKYNRQGFSIGVTDYWCDLQEAPYRKNHVLESHLEYQLQKIPLNMECNMLIAGDNNYFLPYVEASYTPEWKEWNFEFAAGFTPWRNTMLATEDFSFTRLSAGISKEIRFSKTFSISFKTSLLYNPDADALFWIAGTNIPF